MTAEQPIDKYRMSGVLDFCDYELFTKEIRVRGGRRFGNEYEATVQLRNLLPEYSIFRYHRPTFPFIMVICLVLMGLVFTLQTVLQPSDLRLIAVEVALVLLMLFAFTQSKRVNRYSFSYESGVFAVHIFELGPQRIDCCEFVAAVTRQIKEVRESSV